MEPEEVVEQVAKTGKNKWFGYLALTTVILAVCATLASFKEGNNSEARKFEQLREDAQRRAETYGIAVIFLQWESCSHRWQHW